MKPISEVETVREKVREPIAYIQKWVTQLTKEASKAEGYTAGEKQVVLMNLNKIDTELQVAKLIIKDDVIPLIDQAIQATREEERKLFKEDLETMKKAAHIGITQISIIEMLRLAIDKYSPQQKEKGEV